MTERPPRFRSQLEADVWLDRPSAPAPVCSCAICVTSAPPEVGALHYDLTSMVWTVFDGGRWVDAMVKIPPLPPLPF